MTATGGKLMKYIVTLDGKEYEVVVENDTAYIVSEE
jgi:hypothetical protein